MAGLLFYDEARYMTPWQLALVLALTLTLTLTPTPILSLSLSLSLTPNQVLGGAAVVMLGIVMSLRSTLKDVVMTRRGQG